MLCRAVLSALAISYLICVLWLSGLQKEDLDVNMLRKLQRHNVNIDDKNRDNLRNDCLNTYKRKDIANEEKNITTDDDDKKTSTLLLESETDTKTKSDESNNNSAMLDIHKDEKQRSDERDTINVREKIELITPRIVNDSESDYLKEETDTSIPKTIEKQVVTNDKPNLENILNFWKMFTTPKNKERIVSVTKPRKTNKIISKKKLAKKSHKSNVERSSKEMEQINRLLADYFYKTENPSTTQSTIISTVDLNNLSKLTQQFEYFFKFIAKNKILPKNSVEVKKDVQNKILETNDRAIDNNYFLDHMPQSFVVKASNKKIVESDANKHTVSDISHLLFFNDQLRKSIAQTNETYPPPYPLVPVIYGLPNYNQQFYSIPDLTVTITTNRPTTTSNDIIIKPQDINNVEKTLSKDLIGMIAENVKAIVLKDLHHEITSTTAMHTNLPSNDTPTATETSATITFTITTTSPTVAATTQKPLENKSSEATQVLRSIMDLFKEFKALKDKTASTVTITPHATLKYEIINENLNNPPANHKNLFVQMINPQQRNMKITQELAKVPFNPYQPQSVIEFRVPTNPAKMGSIDSNNKFQFPVQNMKGSEIIQTNSGEIAPLSIPLSKPLQFIHQNIVVTTAPPVAEILNSREWASNYYEKPNHRDESSNIRSKLERYRYSTHFEYNSTPSNRERTHALHSTNLNQQESSLSQYKPHTSHRESNYSKYNTNIFHRDSNRSPYRSNSRIQHNSNPSDRDYLKQYDSNQLKSNSNPTKFDLLFDRYSTRIPQFRPPLDNDRYDVRDRGHSYAEESIISNRGRKEYRLGYTPRNEMSVLSKIENGFIEAKNYESKNNNYKGIGGSGIRKPDAERFHERLERVYAWRDENKANLKEMEKCCDNLALASRQQLALNTMKTKYDDSHFKNFLKTQQKVNDMLEKMLASKNSEPRSVEII